MNNYRNSDNELAQKIVLVRRDNNNKYGFSLAGHNPVVIKAVRKGENKIVSQS